MIFKTSIYCCHEAEISPATTKLDITAAIPPIIPAPTKAGIIGTKILEIAFNTFLNGEVLFCFAFCCAFI